MINWSNRVLTNVKIYVSDKCDSVQADSSRTPPRFPAVSVVQIDSPERGMDSENKENAIYSAMELQAFSNQSLKESEELMAECCDAMRSMGYVRNSGPYPVLNAEDKNIHRTVARFSRIIGSDDVIPRFEKEDF